jgi:hypothetical protein
LNAAVPILSIEILLKKTFMPLASSTATQQRRQDRHVPTEGGAVQWGSVVTALLGIDTKFEESVNDHEVSFESRQMQRGLPIPIGRVRGAASIDQQIELIHAIEQTCAVYGCSTQVAADVRVGPFGDRHSFRIKG